MGEPALAVREQAVELRLIAFLEQPPECGPRGDAQRQQVVAVDQRRRCRLQHTQLAGAFPQPVARLEGAFPRLAPPLVVGFRDHQQAVQAAHAPGKTPDGGVARAVPEELLGAQVPSHQGDDLLREVPACADALQPFAGQLGAELRVAVGGELLAIAPRGRWLPEVVAEYCQPGDEILLRVAAARSGVRVQAGEGVGPYVSFRVPSGILGAVAQRFELGVIAEPARGLQERETA